MCVDRACICDDFSSSSRAIYTSVYIGSRRRSARVFCKRKTASFLLLLLLRGNNKQIRIRIPGLSRAGALSFCRRREQSHIYVEAICFAVVIKKRPLGNISCGDRASFFFLRGETNRTCV